MHLVEKMWLFNRKVGYRSDPDPKWFIPDPDPDPAKSSGSTTLVGWPLLWAGGFFCTLAILYGGLGIGKLQFLNKKFFFFFSAVIFFQFLVIKALDPDWIRIRIRIGLHPDPYGSGSGSGSVKNEYGSETLVPLCWFFFKFLLSLLFLLINCIL